ncbi:MAG: UDP-2,3-diacylglucosamine diphosphatase LpxI [Alphaproteobacteria bacterium]|nr:UDP-2,3-diacylglucosamine diphosphatase LpxI [Alphaproteobacteria bacterium]
MATRLGIIAGGGALPRRLAEHVRTSGDDPFLLGVSGFVDPSLVAEFNGVQFAIGEIGKQIDALNAAGCRDIVFAGVVKRPDFQHLRLDVRGALILPRLVAAAAKGDDALLRVIVAVFSEAGFNVLGADDVIVELLCPAGPLGAHKPGEAHWSDIRHAARIARVMGEFDIGQGAVSCGGVILAVEAQEGTDSMIDRCAGLPPELRGSLASRRGVLVKRPKPIQERRIDLPTIGPQTVKKAAAAGFAGIALEAGGALVLDRAETAALADASGLFVYGFRADETA